MRKYLEEIQKEWQVLKLAASGKEVERQKIGDVISFISMRLIHHQAADCKKVRMKSTSI